MENASLEEFARQVEWARWIHQEYQTMLLGASIIKELPSKPKK